MADFTARRGAPAFIMENAFSPTSSDDSSASGGDVVAWAYFYFEKVKRYG
jgi:hypothetical protein